MKHYTKIIIIISLTLCSCKPSPQIYFSKSQPENKGLEKKFNDIIIGKYIDSDSSILEIRTNQIIWTYFSIRIDSLLTDTINGKLIIQPIETKILNCDTLFSFKDNEELKFTKGIYFLNKQIEENKWSLILLKRVNNEMIELPILCYEKFVFSDSSECDLNEIEKLMNISTVSTNYSDSDTTNISDYNVNINKRELMNYIKNGGFADKRLFLKIK